MTEENLHTPSLVLEHVRVLSTLQADIAHIKKVVDNGLSAKLASVDATLSKFMSDTAIRNIEIKAENWFTRILNGSATKIVSLTVGFILVNAVASSSFNSVIKSVYFDEPKGQQVAILNQQKELKSELSGYHTHLLKDSKVLYHSGRSDCPAWVLNTTTNTWVRAPQMRTETGINAD